MMSTRWRRKLTHTGLIVFAAPAVLPLLLSAAFADWPMGGHDARGTRANAEESALGPANVGHMEVLWSVPTPVVVFGTPAVVGDTVFAADFSGLVYALDSATGLPRWISRVLGPVTLSTAVTSTRVIVGDWGGFLYGLDRTTGLVAWMIRPNNYAYAAIYGPPTVIQLRGPLGSTVERVVVGVASNEETVAQDPHVPCCSARGSVVMLDPETGAVQWQTLMISDAEAAAGSAGASVWTAPAYDPELNLVFVTTGNNFSEPPTPTSDAILALDATDGHFVRMNQRTPDDTWVWHYNSYEGGHPDADFGDSPAIHFLPSGRKVVSAGQKNGFMHLVDAASGATIDSAQFLPGGGLGGFFADSAVVGSLIFANGSDWTDYKPSFLPGGSPAPKSGSIIAIAASERGLAELWRFSIPGSANLGGTAVANGVVYFHSGFTKSLFALDAVTGAKLAAIEVGPAVSGPSVSGGRVFVGTGDFTGLSGNYAPGGSVTALGVDGS